LAHTVQLAQGNFSKPSFPPLRRVHLVFNQLPLDRHRRARLLQRELLRRDLPAKHSGAALVVAAAAIAPGIAPPFAGILLGRHPRKRLSTWERGSSSFHTKVNDTSTPPASLSKSNRKSHEQTCG